MCSRVFRSLCLRSNLQATRCYVTGSGGYKLDFSVGFLPHPLKKPYGEDAYFICNALVMGVADGVGGSALHGIDPGEYASGLMAEAHNISSAMDSSGKRICPLEVLQGAYEAVSDVAGSTTACIAALNGDVLDVCNLGDSGCMIMRNNEILYMSKEQTHGFNYPFQLGAESQDSPMDADMSSHTITEGDFVLLATDGVFDNLFQEQILDLFQKYQGDFSALGTHVAEAAFDMASNRTENTPYAIRCHTMIGVAHMGGKMDDITAVVARVCRV
uniref:Protein phosphatase n=1 Tax=Eutreptiella gymnastica TaxID=73025 RepID=A0A7S4LJK5_9EUGL